MKRLKKFFDREQNLLIHITATILVITFGIYFKISLLEWFLVLLVVSLVISCELINSAIELAVDLKTMEYHPLARVAKDTAAGAVLTAAITALIVGIYIFLPKFIGLVS